MPFFIWNWEISQRKGAWHPADLSLDWCTSLEEVAVLEICSVHWGGECLAVEALKTKEIKGLSPCKYCFSTEVGFFVCFPHFGVLCAETSAPYGRRKDGILDFTGVCSPFLSRYDWIQKRGKFYISGASQPPWSAGIQQVGFQQAHFVFSRDLAPFLLVCKEI